MKKLFYELIFVIIGLFGVDVFILVHSLLVNLDPNFFARTCVAIVSVSIIIFRNMSQVRHNRD